MTKPNLLLLHAFPLHAALFADMVPFLSGFNVCAPDFLGFGSQTGNLPSEGLPSLALLAQAAAESAEECFSGQPYFVAGVSMGGYVALEMMAEQLRRGAEGQRITGLALIDSKATSDSEAAITSRLSQARSVRAQGVEVLAPMLGTLLGQTTQTARGDVVAKISAMMAAVDPVAVEWAQLAMAARPNYCQELGQFEATGGVVGVIRGLEDEVVKAEDVFESLADCQAAWLIEIQETGHLAPIETPEAVATALREIFRS